jgi:tRNA(Arg) A34 adenosine deaminase TadA
MENPTHDFEARFSDLRRCPDLRRRRPSCSRAGAGDFHGPDEQFMRLAIDQACKNPVYPFGAVMVQPETGEVMARGVNRSGQNPTFHGEIDCMDDYVRRSGNQGWSPRVLYTAGEPCSMCMSALVWAGIGGVMFGSSIDGIWRAGIDQINITAKAVIDASPFYKGTLLGGVLQAETDRLFMERKKS